MKRKAFEWRDEDNWKGTVEHVFPHGVGITLYDSTNHVIPHAVTNHVAMTIAFHTMCLASPALPSAGEFWIVEVDGKRRVVQVQDTPTAETLRDDVQFIARIPVEAE